MKYVVTKDQMRIADNNTSQYFLMDSMILMERAALSVAEYIKDNEKQVRSVCVLAGSGGNGGDGVALSRILKLRGYEVCVFLCTPFEKWNDSMKKQVEIGEKYGLNFVYQEDDFFTRLQEKQADLWVDGLFGNGLSRNITGNFKTFLELFHDKAGRKIALDIPSGIHGDTGAILGIAARVDVTVTFAFCKRGLLFYPGAYYAGKVIVTEIGITKESFLNNAPKTFWMEEEDFCGVMKRDAFGNKGTFGKVLVLGGSYGMAGACIFSAKSALRCGAGMVKIMTDEKNREIIQKSLPEAMLSFYEKRETHEESFEKRCTEQLRKELMWADICVVGPGLSRGANAKMIVKCLFEALEGSKCHSVIVDADAIFLIAMDEALQRRVFFEKKVHMIVTPHVLEFSRLSGIGMEELKKDFFGQVSTFCTDKNAIFVCKDARSVVCYENEQYIYTLGTDALATAGSGDCLTGMIAGILGVTKDPYVAAKAGVFLHGLCGRIAGNKKTNLGVMATDLCDAIPEAIQEMGLFVQA